MKHLTLLLLSSLLLACAGKETPETNTESPLIDTPASLPVPEPPEVERPVPDLPPGNHLTLAEFLDQYRIDSLTGLRLEGCTLPRRFWLNPQNFSHADLVYVTGSPHTLSLYERPLFAHEIYPGEFLIVRSYDELMTQIELVVVDTTLKVLFGPREIGCGGSGDEILGTVFTAGNRFATRRSAWKGDLNDGTKLYHSYTETITLEPGGESRTKMTAQSYHFQQPYFATESDLAQGDVNAEMLSHGNPPFALPAEAILAPNSVGVATMTSDTGDYYHLDVRFPGQLTGYARQLLSAHYIFENELGVQYTEDMTFTTTPVTVSFYDTLGQTITIDTFSRMRLRFYCENDGPMITDPSFELRLKKTAYPGALRPLHPEAEKVVAVALARPDADRMPPPLPEPERWELIRKIATVRSQPAGPLLAVFYHSRDPEDYDMPCLYFRPTYAPRLMNINCCGP